MAHLLVRWLFIAMFFAPCLMAAEEKHYFQTDFTIDEFSARRATVFEKIGKDAIALIQGGSGAHGFSTVRQTNSFYYLCGLETPHAYLLLNGRNGQTTLYLPHRDARRERSEGKTLSAEDVELVKTLTGVDAVKGVEFYRKTWWAPV